MIYLHVSIANPNSSEIPRVPKFTTFLKISRCTNSETRPPKINSPPKVQDDPHDEEHFNWLPFQRLTFLTFKRFL